MADLGGMGRVLIVLGVVLVLVGLGLSLGPRIPWLGRLPGDFSFGGANWRVYVPLGTSILISVLLTLVLWLIGRK
ncbi:MAG TPA: DUF2905 domain-containing protein [Candidatus Binatia bacterium]|nr:DUF2905 domain-containing protein [Candidatus Binatia bacterium]